jgi:hypothetical protein
MSDSDFVVQKVDWYQFRAPDGTPVFVMVSGLPNGFFPAVPCELNVKLGDHSLMALAPSAEEALKQLQGNLAGKTVAEIFPDH